MLEHFIQWVSLHADKAHWYIFCLILLAGLNIPISIDLMIICSAVLAVSFVPEHTLILYLSVFFGCIFSAWISYWFGRLLGSQLKEKKFFQKILPDQKIEKLKNFYERYGLWTLVIGRFIPFGIRNCLFLTSGMTKTSFKKFAIRDAIACALWSGICFSLFYFLGQNYTAVWEQVKTFQVYLIGIFGITGISFLCYKKRKKNKKTINNMTSSTLD